MISFRTLARVGGTAALALGLGLSTLGSATASTTVSKPTDVTRPADVETTSGHTAQFTVHAEATGATYTWQYSPDLGQTWKPLVGKTSSTLTIQAITARDGWKVRAKVSNSAGYAYSHSALLRVHSTVSDPFPVVSDGSVGAATSGWYWSVVKTGHSSTAVSAYVLVSKYDRTALVSDLRAAFRDSSGAGTATTITKYETVDSSTVIVKIRATPSAAALASSTGDVWKIRDSVTGEYEYFATK